MASPFAIFFGYMPLLSKLYLRRTAASVLAWSLLILLLIECIFLAEKLTAILRTAIDKHAQLIDVLLELLCTAPEIFSLAVPIAVMFGVYRVTLRCREDREFLVIAGTGNGFRQFLYMIFVMALVAQLVSLLVTGLIEPLTRFGERAILFNAEYRAIRHGLPMGQFYQFPGHTVFALPHKAGAPQNRMFIYAQGTGTSDRVVTADHADVAGPSAEGILTLELANFTSYEFAKAASALQFDQFIVRPSVGLQVSRFCLDCRLVPEAKPLTTLQAHDLVQPLALNEILPFKPRGIPASAGDGKPSGSAAEEWTLFELLGVTTRPSGAGRDEVSALGALASRSLLCLIAPLIALLAVERTTRATQAFAFPLACLMLLCLDLAGTALAKGLAAAGLGLMLTVLCGSAAAILIAMLGAVLRWQQALVKPALARA